MQVKVLLVPVLGERRVVIVAVLFSMFLLGSMSGVVFASSENWVEVIRFTGSESTQTEQFTCGHVDWRIRWEYTARYYTVFTLLTYKDNGTVVDSVHKVYEFTVRAAETNGTSYIYNMNGTFYMTIDAVDVSYFTVIVEQNVDSIPEFPSWIILPLVLTATLVIVIFRKRLRKGVKSGNYL